MPEAWGLRNNSVEFRVESRHAQAKNTRVNSVSQKLRLRHKNETMDGGEITQVGVGTIREKRRHIF